MFAGREAQVITNAAHRVDAFPPASKATNIAERLKSLREGGAAACRRCKLNLKRNAVSHRMQLSRLGACRVTTIRRSPLPVVRCSLTQSELVQQIIRQRGCELNAVHVRTLHGQSVERIGPRSQARLRRRTPGFFLSADEAEFVI